MVRNRKVSTSSCPTHDACSNVPIRKAIHGNCGKQEEFEITKQIIRIRKSKKDRQHSGQNIDWLVFNANFSNISAISWRVKRKLTKGQTTIYKTLHRKTKNRATGGELRCPGRVCSSCSAFDTRRVTAKRHEHHLIKNDSYGNR